MVPNASREVKGDRPERPALERLTVELGVTERMTLTGDVPAPEAVVERRHVGIDLVDEAEAKPA